MEKQRLDWIRATHTAKFRVRLHVSMALGASSTSWRFVIFSKRLVIVEGFFAMQRDSIIQACFLFEWKTLHHPLSFQNMHTSLQFQHHLALQLFLSKIWRVVSLIQMLYAVSTCRILHLLT